MSNPLLRSLRDLWNSNKSPVLLATPSGTLGSDGKPQAAPVGPEYPLPVGLYVLRAGAWVPWDGYALAASPPPGPPVFSAMNFTGADDMYAYSTEFTLPPRTSVTVQFTNPQGDAGALVTQEAWDGSAWVNLATNALDSATQSADFVNGYTADKYRFRVAYQRHTTGNETATFCAA